MIVKLDFKLAPDAELAAQVREIFQQWKSGNGLQVDDTLLKRLLEAELTVLEKIPVGETDSSEEADARPEKTKKTRTINPDGLFQRSVKPRLAPKKIRAITKMQLSKKVEILKQTPDSEPVEESVTATGFVMILQNTDMGRGQKTKGASARSPEIFIPLAARNFFPEFWGWQERFAEDPTKPGKFDRWKVPCRLGGEIIEINMMTWPVKHDFRLRSQRLRSAGSPGDILRLERTGPESGFDYYVEIIPQGTSAFEQYSELCKEKVHNSLKRWGYYGF